MESLQIDTAANDRKNGTKRPRKQSCRMDNDRNAWLSGKPVALWGGMCRKLAGLEGT